MALPAVLGLLSESIRFHDTAAEVAAKIAAAPDLSDAEREDLLRIPHERLAPYQHDIYVADRGMLEWGFTHTWRCLQQLQFGAAQDEVEDPEQAFILHFKRNYPCTTHSVRELGALFVKYLAREQTLLLREHPWLLELAETERLEIEVLYALDNPLGQPLDSAAREAFFSRSLDEVLSARIVRAEAVQVLQYRHDIPAIKRALASVDEDERVDFDIGPFLPAHRPLYFAIARDHDSLEPSWYVADEADAAFVAATREQVPQSIETHAEAVLPLIAPGGMPEEEQIAHYLLRLERALRLRYVLAA